MKKEPFPKGPFLIQIRFLSLALIYLIVIGFLRYANDLIEVFA